MPRPADTMLAARGHLRLAPEPEDRTPAESRAALVARGLVVPALLLWLAVVAFLAATAALLPLLWRGAPLGRRLRPAAPREARIIPFQARRQALPR